MRVGGKDAPCTRFEVPTDECAVEQKVHGGVQARIVLLGPPDVVLAADPHGGADSPLLQNSGVDFVEREGGASSEAATIKQDFARVVFDVVASGHHRRQRHGQKGHS